MDAWAWSAMQPWLAERSKLPVGPLFCVIVGPTRGQNLGEFLDYFMVRKVIAGQELRKASGTVTGKLVRWLADRG